MSEIEKFADEISTQIVALLKLYEGYKENKSPMTESDLTHSVKEIIHINIKANKYICKCLCRKNFWRNRFRLSCTE